MYSRPFARRSRSAELAAAVAASNPSGSGVISWASPSASKPVVPSATSTSAAAQVIPACGSSTFGEESESQKASVTEQEYVLSNEYDFRVPKSLEPISIMRFNGSLAVDPDQWTSVRMMREDNTKLYKTEQDNQPLFGAGSEYGRKEREEAKRRKYERNRKKYDAKEQPWLMKSSEPNGKRKYRGIKEGGITENASYYIFMQSPEGHFDVHPVSHWYNFTPVQRYKSLTAEEAEEQFGRRKKIHNYFSVMVKNRLKGEDDSDEKMQSPKDKPGRQSASMDLKVSEMDDWSDSDNEDSDGESEKTTKPKKMKKKSNNKAEEDSDDGDEEGREIDYISEMSETGSESEDEKDKKSGAIGVDQEDGLKNLLDSDSDEEDNQKKEAATEQEQNEKGKKKARKRNSGKKKLEMEMEADAASKNEQMTEETLSREKDDDKTIQQNNPNESVQLESADGGVNRKNSRDEKAKKVKAAVASCSKRKASSDFISGQIGSSKKAKTEKSPKLVKAATVSEKISEEAVRMYLLRKPLTITQLLQKFKSKKRNTPTSEIASAVADILKKINPPYRLSMDGKMFFYLNK